jgi:signal transduction histidine kinase
MEIEKIVFQATLMSIVLLTALILFFIFLIKSSTNKRKADLANFELAFKNKELEQLNAVIVAQEKERAKIASNLHDEVGSILSMAQRNLDFVMNQMAADAPHKEELQFSLTTIDQSITKIRNLSNSMLPHFLVKFGLIKSLQRLAYQTETTLSHPCHFTTNCPDDFQLEQQQEIHMYAILLELINNTLKHAHPHAIQLQLLKNNEKLVLSIQHDGVAINQEEYEHLLNHSEGVGLSSVVNRLAIIKGEINYSKTPLGGLITVEMPL